MISYYPKPPFVAQKTQQQKQSPQIKASEPSEFNIPNLPLLGEQTPAQILNKLHKTIVDEATAIDFYTRLSEMAQTKEQKAFILDIVSEETSHLKMFTSLYKFLTGTMPSYTITPTKFDSFKQGVFIALQGELDAMDFYKRMILSTTDELIQQAYYFALGDETEHAIIFSTILSQL